MSSGLELINYNPDPVKSAVMARAAELRDEGYDKSDALSIAWDEVEDEEEELEADELVPQSRRRSNPTTADNPLGSGVLLFGLVIGYFVWCGIKYKQTGMWSWTPWKLTTKIVYPTTTQQLSSYHSRNNTQETVQLIVP